MASRPVKRETDLTDIIAENTYGGLLRFFFISRAALKEN